MSREPRSISEVRCLKTSLSSFLSSAVDEVTQLVTDLLKTDAFTEELRSVPFREHQLFGVRRKELEYRPCGWTHNLRWKRRNVR